MIEERRRSMDIEFGKLIASVESLTSALKEMQEEIRSLEDRMNTGKGMVVGMMMVTGGIGAGASHFIHELFK